MSVHADRLLAEVDRQLAEVRVACDGLATRAGLLMTTTALGAVVVAARIGTSRHQVLLVLALVAFGLATVSGVVTLMPDLRLGPTITELGTWWDKGQPTPESSVRLYDTKVGLVEANTKRWVRMRTLLAYQTAFTIAAVGLTLGYAAWK